MEITRDYESARGEARVALDLLAAGIPLSLLLDLVGLTPSDSARIATEERADTSWVPVRGVA